MPRTLDATEAQSPIISHRTQALSAVVEATSSKQRKNQYLSGPIHQADSAIARDIYYKDFKHRNTALVSSTRRPQRKLKISARNKAKFHRSAQPMHEMNIVDTETVTIDPPTMLASPAADNLYRTVQTLETPHNNMFTPT